MACHGMRNYLKDLRSLYINIGDSTNEQAIISSVCGGTLEILLTPNEGPYAHATFILEIATSDDYPRTRPEIRLLTPIFHPNINPQGGYICLSIMDDWNSCYSFLDVIKAVLFLLANPNFDSANNSFGSLPPEYRDRFNEMCKQFLAGFPIKGEVHPANENWCKWARANNCFPVPKLDQNSCESQPPTHSTLDITPSGVATEPLEEQLKDNVRTRLSDVDLASNHLSFSTPSTYVPSVANVRYSIGTESDKFGSIYSSDRTRYLQTLRILLYQQESRSPRIFYFCDFLGCVACQDNRQPVYLYNQTGLETPEIPICHQSVSQTSSFIEWTSYRREFYTGERYSSYSYSPTINDLSTLFHVEDVDTNTYELFPECGNYVLCALFAEPRSRPKQMVDDPLDELMTLEEFFNLSCEDGFAYPFDGHQSIAEEGGEEKGERDEGLEEDQSARDESLTSPITRQNNGEVGEGREVEMEEEESLSSCVSGQINGEVEEEVDSYANHSDANEDERGSENLLSYLYGRQNNVNNESFSQCYDCSWYYNRAVETMQEITPSEWIFFQTRWPPVLAPQQSIDFEANFPTQIPSWRGSTPRLVKDVVLFCRQHLQLDCLLLLDPLALSPWSPVLNAFCPLAVDSSSSSPHRLSAATKRRERWTSLLWLTAAEPSSNKLTLSKHIFGPHGSRWLHSVARVALISNWLAWFSRVEIAAVLGQSRLSSRIVCEGVATACLHPASLGCGQAPLFDVWPLWLARLLLRSSCGLFARLCASAATRTLCYFPLSDTDEI
uniref:UBC core domain-containing protein n=1 Tax=Schistocephalus solidus TaxID=70667 RepID=A0A0X3P5J0_SCHSO